MFFIHEHKKSFLAGLIFVFAFLAAYPTLQYDFFGDDTILILENPDVQSMGKVPQLFQKDFFDRPLVGIESRSLIGYYRPITKTTFALDWMMWQRNPMGYHLTNILIHSLICVCLFYLMIYLGISQYAAFWMTCVFSVFPTHDQAISLINARSDLLCVLGIMFACLGHAIKNRYLLLLGCILAPFSKEQGVFVPLMLLIFIYFHNSKVTKHWIDLLISIACLGLYFLLRHFAITPTPTDWSSIVAKDHFILIGKLMQVIGFSMIGLNTSKLWLLLMPQTPFDPGVLLGWTVFFICLVVGIYSLLYKKYHVVSFSWVLLGFAPMLMAHRLSMPLGKDIAPIMDRWSYLPSVGIMLILASVVNQKYFSKKNSYIFFGIVIPVFLFALWLRLPTYKDDKSFNVETIKMYQQVAYEKLPTALLVRRLDTEGVLLAEENKYQAALEHLLLAYQANPDDVLVQANLGVVYAHMADYDKAIFYVKKSLELKKVYQKGDQVRYIMEDDHARNRPKRYAALGEIYRRAGKLPQSEEAMRNAVEGDPTNLVYLNNLAGVIASQGKIPEARDIYLRILTIDQCYPSARESLQYIVSKKRDDALQVRLLDMNNKCPR